MTQRRKQRRWDSCSSFALCMVFLGGQQPFWLHMDARAD